MLRHPRLPLRRDLFLPDRHALFEFVDHPAAGVEGCGAVGGTGGNEDDIVTGLHGGDAVHDAGIEQVELADGFFAQFAHLGQRHAAVGFEADLADVAAF